jgi:hypothetical protein
MDDRERQTQNKYGIYDQWGHNRKTCQTKQHMWIFAVISNY